MIDTNKVTKVFDSEVARMTAVVIATVAVMSYFSNAGINTRLTVVEEEHKWYREDVRVIKEKLGNIEVSVGQLQALVPK